ncbi:LLM class flavin-dependent oxidoreductase [Acinetobacter portensis]|uniref:LLM class flavin-dependent oxidoreductase n=2 Tax=Acinetobacter TaxID=469 RepID=A0AB35UZN5_9GAMM|nr:MULTISPECIES: LLM class flavin-dependent oxidoreductase [Acinetobacter]MCK7609279.1 LLM class flavin-dependent oxidoreductase [Acinetobacter portensis]MCK7640056.1 LLM class flavin-dependent oxidoreductase [Acinetobacter portensis]MDY6459895.1 LLM class flavin-dependent oxidoreductase [Acinetobacter faecalis]MDY6461936.1 LLM class flavin-dependent oxidoreductase [Acinetobacter faecalis]MDY6486817.1 LLM class flavin-dependent oxidoreductase [Acinetobacter faecalis]
MAKRQIKLGAFIPTTSQHAAGWRHPESRPQDHLSIDYAIELAKTAEKGLFDAYFLADGLSVNWSHGASKNANTIGYTDKAVGFEPVTLFSAISAVTKNIGFIATASTTYEDPYLLARKFASLDHISKGRAGWNVVTTSAADTARNFNFDRHPDPALRYERADEFIEVTQKLWDSWADDAFKYDKKTGQFFEASQSHEPLHSGKYFNVQGALNVPRPPQGYPVIVQAGQSEAGRELAAKYAEVIFTSQQNLEDAQAFYRDIKGRLVKYGRHADDIKIMPGVSIFVAKTEEEAQAKYDLLNSLILPDVGLGLLSGLSGGIDLSKYDLDAPFPKINDADLTFSSRQQLIIDIAKEHNFTIRQLYEYIASARGHWTLIGTPEQVVNQLQTWFENEAADGFNVLPPSTPAGLNDFVEFIVPELQRRGLFRTKYEGTTLRENLGLKRPENQYVVASRLQNSEAS